MQSDIEALIKRSFSMRETHFRAAYRQLHWHANASSTSSEAIQTRLNARVTSSASPVTVCESPISRAVSNRSFEQCENEEDDGAMAAILIMAAGITKIHITSTEQENFNITRRLLQLSLDKLEAGMKCGPFLKPIELCIEQGRGVVPVPPTVQKLCVVHGSILSFQPLYASVVALWGLSLVETDVRPDTLISALSLGEVEQPTPVKPDSRRDHALDDPGRPQS
jgi:hypothetical protein